MGWRDELARVTLPDGRKLIGASFRGVSFFVESSDRSGGARRTVTHEFYKANEPAIDDTGRRAVSYQVEGYVLGEDYLRQRDRLIVALEGVEGPGELVHPYYGRKRAICSSLGVRESTRDGGVATFSLGFEDAPDRPAPTEIPDLAGAVATSAARAFVASQQEFESLFDVTGTPSFAIASLRADLAGVAATLGDKLAPLAATSQELALLSVSIDLIAAETAALIRTPADVLDSLLASIRKLATAIEVAPLTMIRPLLDAYAYAAPPAVLGDTSTRIQERINQAAFGDAVRRTLATEAARLLPLATFTSTDQATALRDDVIAVIDELAGTAGNEAFPALATLRAAVLQAVPGDAKLARVLTIERRVDVPSLLLSYEIYGNTAQEADIVARNGIQHPALVSGSIKVLSDV